MTSIIINYLTKTASDSCLTCPNHRQTVAVVSSNINDHNNKTKNKLFKTC